MKRDDQHSVRNIPNIRNDKNFSLLIILKNNEIGTLSLDLELTLFMVTALTTWPRCLECRRVCTTPEPPHRCPFFHKENVPSTTNLQDVAMMMEMLLGAGHIKLGDIDELLRKHLSRKLNPTDVVNIVEVLDAFQGTKIPPELIAKIMLMQKAIESDISSPEMSSQDLASKLKRPNCR